MAARVPITYKILYNDAVAMTGDTGRRPAVGRFDDAPTASRGVEKIVVVTDHPEKYAEIMDLAPAYRGTPGIHRIQRELREFPASPP